MANDPQFIPRPPSNRKDLIETHSIVSHRTGRGIVVVEWGDMGGQFDPEDARVFAHTLMREADNAETDAMVYSFFKDTVGADPRRVAQLITEFRRARAEREKLAGLRPTDEIPPEDRR